MYSHFYEDIPGWASFQDLYFQVVKDARDGAHFVEIGCWLGRSVALMAVEIANSGKTIRFDCVDHWLGNPELAGTPEMANGTLYESFLRNVAPVRGFLNPVRLPSLKAAATYADGSLDFVMIDASHVYEDCIADIRAWLPKIRRGGTLAGDDYHFPGVARAVGEAFGERAIIHTAPLNNIHYGPCRYWTFHPSA